MIILVCGDVRLACKCVFVSVYVRVCRVGPVCVSIKTIRRSRKAAALDLLVARR